MKRIVMFNIVALVILMATLNVFGATYYVSEFGDDSNDGLSEAASFATIQKGADVAVAGDMVEVDFGEYAETIVPKSNGTDGNPIVFKAKEAGQAEISNGETTLLPTFTLHAGNVYVMDNVSRTVASVSENGAPLTKRSALADLDLAPGIYQDRVANKLYVRSSDDADPATKQDTVFFSEYAVDIVEGSYITIEGFSLKNRIKAVVAANAVPLPGLVIKNNVFAYDDKDVGSNAITIQGGPDSVNTYEQFSISGNMFNNGATLRILDAGRNSVIADNSFPGNEAEGIAALPLRTGADVIRIEGSDGAGVQCDGLVFERNFISHANQRAMYIRYGTLSDITLQNNIFYKGFFACIDVKNTTNLDVLNNTFVLQGASHPVRFRTNTSGRVYNNICAYTTRGNFWFFDIGADSVMLWDMDYNYYVNDTTLVSDNDNEMVRSKISFANSSDLPGGPNAVYGHPMKAGLDTVVNVFGETVYLTEIPDMEADASPLFADTSDGLAESLKLVAGSNAIGTANAAIAPADDFFGNTRTATVDMGAIADEFILVSVDEGANGLPGEFALFTNYPNPFNPVTTIKYSLAKSEHVKLTVFNVVGQKIATLYDAEQSQGSFDVKWNGLDDQGCSVSSGVYFYSLEAGSITKTMKMMLLK